MDAGATGPGTLTDGEHEDGSPAGHPVPGAPAVTEPGAATGTEPGAATGTGEHTTLGPAAYRALYEHSPDGVLFTSPDGGILAANPAACAILGMTEADICRLGRLGLADPDDPRWEVLLAVRQREGRARGVARMRRGDGSLFEAEMSAEIFTDEAGELRTCTIVRDVSERVAMEENLRALTARLQEMSLTDELTGLRNRRAAMTLGAQLIEVADRQRQELQVLFVDVDKLKALNDSLGHGAGDAALRAVAQALSSVFRRSDLVARIGGDEFLAVTLGLRQEDRAGLERRIRGFLSVAEVARSVGQPVQVSFGWVTRPAGGSVTLEELMARADEAMYEARGTRRAGGR